MPGLLLYVTLFEGDIHVISFQSMDCVVCSKILHPM